MMYPEPEPADPRWRESRQPSDPTYGGNPGSGWDSTPPPTSGGTYRSSSTPHSPAEPYSPSAPSSGGAPYSGAPYSGAPNAPYSGAPQAPYQGDQGGYQPPAASFSGGQPPYGDGGQAPFAQPYGQPPKPKSKLPLILGIIGAVVVLCIAGVIVLAVIGKKAGDDLAASTSTTATSTPRKNPSGNPSEQSVEGDLERYKAGDCLTITGTDNTVKPAKCTDAGAYKVVLRKDGTTSETACDKTDATETLYQDGTGTANDLILCVKPVK